MSLKSYKTVVSEKIFEANYEIQKSKFIATVKHVEDEEAAKKISKNEANLRSLDVMLKYKIVNKKTVEQLIVLDKLKSVKHTNKVLKKY